MSSLVVLIRNAAAPSSAQRWLAERQDRHRGPNLPFETLLTKTSAARLLRDRHFTPAASPSVAFSHLRNSRKRGERSFASGKRKA